MRGNPHVLTDTRFNLNRESTDVRLTLWLGLPTAREYFDPSTLSPADEVRMAGSRGSRRRADFEVSRALLAFAGGGADTHSLSHSAEHAALLIAPTGWRIGVDLEINRPRDVLRLARLAFDGSEVRAIESAAPDARRPLFYTLWTLKESFAKALQLSLVDALRQCVFSNDGGTWHGRVPARATWGAAVYQPRPDIFLAAAWLGGTDAVNPEQREWPPQRRADWPLIAACAGTPESTNSA